MVHLTTPSKIRSQNPVSLDHFTHTELLDYFVNTWELYEILFSSIVSEKSFYLAPDPLRHPLIFYWGHTAVFYINKLRIAGLIAEGINPHFEKLFAVGVDPDSPENLDVHDLWPPLEAVHEYRRMVFEMVQNIIKECPIGERIDKNSPWWALMMAIEHDRIHFETSSMLLRQLPSELLACPEEWNYAPTFGAPLKNKMIEVEGGQVFIGKKEDDSIFGWDNEYGHLEKKVAPFVASQNLISNAEYLDFVESGSYNEQSFWTTEGWEWKTEVKNKHPKFWVKQNDNFSYRTIFDVLPMPLDWPAEVNAHEAWAYCRWKGENWRLLTEAEFTLIAKTALADKGKPAFSDQYNINLIYGSPSPVGFMDKAPSDTTFNDLYGNVWDWLSNDFCPLPGFETHPYYEDFSNLYFDDQHSMLLGGAWATTGAGASHFYRLWFRRNFFQHAGFRLAKNK